MLLLRCLSLALWRRCGGTAFVHDGSNADTTVGSNFISNLLAQILVATGLVDTLERRDSFALVFVESCADDAAILELNVGAVRVMLE